MQKISKALTILPMLFMTHLPAAASTGEGVGPEDANGAIDLLVGKDVAELAVYSRLETVFMLMLRSGDYCVQRVAPEEVVDILSVDTPHLVILSPLLVVIHKETETI